MIYTKRDNSQRVTMIDLALIFLLGGTFVANSFYYPKNKLK